MKVAPDTNVLVRLVMGDDSSQQRSAAKLLEGADAVAISAHALCEFAWVLERSYGVARADIADAIRRMLDMRNVIANRPCVESGLAILDAGGDFADGVIAFEGQWLGGETFASFDKRAVRLVKENGSAALLLT